MAYERTRRPVMLGNDKSTYQRKHKPDYLIVLISLSLLAIGLVLIYSISPGLAVSRGVDEGFYITKQFIAIFAGIVAFCIAGFIPLKKIEKSYKLLIIGAIALTGIALVLPTSAEYQAHRWVRLGGLSLQSVELVKLALIVSLPVFLVEKMRTGHLNNMQKTLKPLALTLGAVGIIIVGFQSDLGSAVVLAIMAAAIAVVAGIDLKYIAISIVIVVLAGSLAISTSQYRKDRFLSFLNPEQNCQTTSYQACQAIVTVGSGGLFGKGIGRGVQAYGYLPEAANDSIFAIHAEKFGFMGSTILLLLFGALFTRLKLVIERAPDLFSRLIVVGVLAWISTQSIMNIGAMIGLLPLKGITLPLISYGGTSMMFIMAALGLVFNISRFTTYASNNELNEVYHDNTAVSRRNRWSHTSAARRRA